VLDSVIHRRSHLALVTNIHRARNGFSARIFNFVDRSMNRARQSRIGLNRFRRDDDSSSITSGAQRDRFANPSTRPSNKQRFIA
jgi:hypothetical protein